VDFDKFIFKANAQARTLDSLDDMLAGAFDKVWPFFGLILFGMFIYGGVMWMMSSGDPQKISKATGTILWAVIGTVILAMIMAIMGVLEYLFGLPAGSIGIFNI